MHEQNFYTIFSSNLVSIINLQNDRENYKFNPFTKKEKFTERMMIRSCSNTSNPLKNLQNYKIHSHKITISTQ